MDSSSARVYYSYHSRFSIAHAAPAYYMLQTERIRFFFFWFSSATESVEDVYSSRSHCAVLTTHRRVYKLYVRSYVDKQHNAFSSSLSFGRAYRCAYFMMTTHDEYGHGIPYLGACTHTNWSSSIWFQLFFFRSTSCVQVYVVRHDH